MPLRSSMSLYTKYASRGTEQSSSSEGVSSSELSLPASISDVVNRVSKISGEPVLVGTGYKYVGSSVFAVLLAGTAVCVYYRTWISLASAGFLISFMAPIANVCFLGNMEKPPPLWARVASAILFVLLTAGIANVPWLLDVSKEQCKDAFHSKDHPDFTSTVYESKFTRYEVSWMAAICRTLALLIVLPATVACALADHAPSMYRRASIRCAFSIWIAQAAITLATWSNVCTGEKIALQINAMLFAFGENSTLINSVWCTWLVCCRLKALEKAFDQALPLLQPTIIMLRIGLWFIAPVIITLEMLRWKNVCFVAFVLGVVWIVGMCLILCRAFSPPIKVLKEELALGHQTLEMLRSESRWALNVLYTERTVAVGTGLTMGFSVAALGMRMYEYSEAWAFTSMLSLNLQAVINVFCVVALSGIAAPQVYSGSGCLGICGDTAPVLDQDDPELGRATSNFFEVVKQANVDRICTCSAEDSNPNDCEECTWNAKVKEMAERAVTLEGLLDFFALLGCPKEVRRADTTACVSNARPRILSSSDGVDVLRSQTVGAAAASKPPRKKGPQETWKRGMMPHFDPLRSTTSDVVRSAIIPASRLGSGGGAAMADVMGCTREEGSVPRFVTHHWGNTFCDMVSAVVADGLGLRRWDVVAERLSAATWHQRRVEVEALKIELAGKGALMTPYWLCPFCINQHASICDKPEGAVDSVTGKPLPSCPCREPKVLNDQPLRCEMNKFQEMMQYLNETHPGFLQVVAIDRQFNLFTRAWCIAELVVGASTKIEQHVLIHSRETLESSLDNLASLRVQDCYASREEDKHAILAKIGGPRELDMFNAQLANLVSGQNGLLDGWLDGENRLQEVGAVAARAFARLQAAECALGAEAYVRRTRSEFSVDYQVMHHMSSGSSVASADQV